MIKNILDYAGLTVSDKIKRFQIQQRRIKELYSLGGITRDIANIELFKLYKKVERNLKFYQFLTTIRIKVQTISVSID